jgi:hypothetical protein
MSQCLLLNAPKRMSWYSWIFGPLLTKRSRLNPVKNLILYAIALGLSGRLTNGPRRLGPANPIPPHRGPEPRSYLSIEANEERRRHDEISQLVFPSKKSNRW